VRITAEQKDKVETRLAKPLGRDDQGSGTSQFDARNDKSDSEFISVNQTPGRAELSVRAVNVLKILAVELTGENPAQGRWTPPDILLKKLTYLHLSKARNCGPQTTAEIMTWSQRRGISIKRSFESGKSLSQMWQDIIEKYSMGQISRSEIAEALEKSTRRRNTRIPVTLQAILIQLIHSSRE
jgi:hypothetical protein